MPSNGQSFKSIFRPSKKPNNSSELTQKKTLTVNTFEYIPKIQTGENIINLAIHSYCQSKLLNIYKYINFLGIDNFCCWDPGYLIPKIYKSFLGEYLSRLADTRKFTEYELCRIIDICIGVKFPSLMSAIREITKGEFVWEKLAISRKNTKKIMPLSSTVKLGNIINFISKSISFYKPQKISLWVKNVSNKQTPINFLHAMTFCMGEFNRLFLLHKSNKEDIELCKMILFEIVYSGLKREKLNLFWIHIIYTDGVHKEDMND